MIKIENLEVKFKIRKSSFLAVKNVSLEIKKGEIFGIVGTSGAGKSTVLRTLNLLQKPTSGKINVFGKQIINFNEKELREYRTKTGMIFQHFNLIHTKTVFENISYALQIAGENKENIESRVNEVLELVGLEDKKNVYPSSLSGGQKQRVGIARAIVNKPELLLCDEPTSALDLETTQSILDLLKKINEKFGITTVIISHEMHVIKNICDNVAVMNDGEVVERGSIYDIFTSPQHEFTKQLVSHTTKLDLPFRLIKNTKGLILKVIYKGERAEEGIISEAIKKFKVNINILHGKIEYISDRPLGILILGIDGTAVDIQNTLTYLKENTEKVEAYNG